MLPPETLLNIAQNEHPKIDTNTGANYKDKVMILKNKYKNFSAKEFLNSIVSITSNKLIPIVGSAPLMGHLNNSNANIHTTSISAQINNADHGTSHAKVSLLQDSMRLATTSIEYVYATNAIYELLLTDYVQLGLYVQPYYLIKDALNNPSQQLNVHNPNNVVQEKQKSNQAIKDNKMIELQSISTKPLMNQKMIEMENIKKIASKMDSDLEKLAKQLAGEIITTQNGLEYTCEIIDNITKKLNDFKTEVEIYQNDVLLKKERFTEILKTIQEIQKYIQNKQPSP
ncbi:hypothetical protein [Chromobacterium haemolyticum]|uniref:hypothetical protein n=1 Tax=Chromobacterium haemolyticum TaxID=394935 RepID=UPI0024469E0E|nr:hypothetical protein [Chromobacterium haemolyticum]MDH0342543.1 hypothetical protein [Chromobacterium haemolyticum]